jgi:nucleoid-associated protein YgaU
MGLFDFVKEAGERLLDNVKEATGRKTAVSAEPIIKSIHDLGLQVENLNVAIDDDLATVSGKATSQGDREKVVLVVGNTQGIARVDDQITVAKPEPEAVFYTVKKGDSLSKIAKAQYGDAMKYPVIFEANRPMLKDPDKIYPGQNLRIPPLAKA